MTKLKDDIIKLRREGLSYNTIKESLGCSKGTISFHLNPNVREASLKRSMSNNKKSRERLRRFINLSKSGGCINCGENHVATLCFHHRDESEKEFTISAGVNQHKYSIKKLQKEIDKCDVLCANCHAMLHWALRHGICDSH